MKSPIPILAALVLISGCRTTEPQAPDDAMRHHNWWNYYQRGTARYAEGRYAAAREDFERCLDLRSGARFGMPREHWRVRTYGRHFLNDYFPHRELGICHLHLGDPGKAGQFLRTSLKQEPSGRAKHYLNQVNTALLAARPVAKPTITISSPGARNWTNAREARVTGSATADGLVSHVAIDGRALVTELAQHRVEFSEAVPLKSGRNTVTIHVQDLKGQTTTKDVIWQTDWRAPRIAIAAFNPRGNEWVVTGWCADDQGLDRIVVTDALNPREIKADGKRRLPFQVIVPQKGNVLLQVRDLAGNRSHESLSAKDIQVSMTRWRMTASAGDDQAVWAMALAAADDDVLDIKDKLPPFVMHGHDRTGLSVATEQFVIHGKVRDGSGIASLSVQGEDQLFLEPGDPHPRRATYHQPVNLAMGTNVFHLVAADAHGNRTHEKIEIVRRASAVLQQKHRLAVGVPEILNVEETSTLLARKMRVYLEGALTQKPRRFRLVARDEMDWGALQREWTINRSNLVSHKARFGSGKRLAADLLFFTEVMEHPEGATVFVRVADVEAGEQKKAVEIYADRQEHDLEARVTWLVMKLAQEYPLLRGRIGRVERGSISMTIGEPHGVTEGMRFIVARNEGESDFLSARVLEHDAEAIQILARDPGDTHSRADVFPDKALPSLQPGDWVYSR